MALVKYNNISLSAITSTGLSTGAMTLIKSQTASSSATISFVDGTSDVVLDNTYPIYLFKFYNIHPETNFRHFSFQANAAGGSGYNETITSTMFVADHNEGDSTTTLSYETDGDLAQGTGVQSILHGVGNGNDESASGELWLFNLSSTTYVKHFISSGHIHTDDDKSRQAYAGGYINTTSAIDEIQFSFSSGDIDSGTIKLYGIKDS